MNKILTLLLVSICSLFILTACTNKKTKTEYTVSFYNEETVVETKKVKEGEKLTEPASPTKSETKENTYVFDGWYLDDKKWDFAVDVVKDNISLKAVFTVTTRLYEIKFINYDNSVISTLSVKYGDKIAKPSNPTRAEADGHSYLFEGWYNDTTKWNFESNTVNGPVSLKANYVDTMLEYTIKFQNDDGTVLSTLSLKYGEMPTEPAYPTKLATAEYTYKFAGWDKKVVNVIGDATYTATYTESKNQYMITFKADETTILQTSYVDYGNIPVIDKKPTKEKVGNTGYIFSGWNNEVVAVTGDATYIAQWTELKLGKGETDTFAAVLASTEKEINSVYNYVSTSESEYPIILKDDALVFNVLSPSDGEKLSHTGALSIDLGAVSSGKSYYINLDIAMADNQNVAIVDGFAYSFAETAGAFTTSSALQAFVVLATNGNIGLIYTPTKDMNNLYVIIRSQQPKNYVGSTLTIDNVLCKEVNLLGASMQNGTVTEDFSEGIVVAEGKKTVYYGNAKVFSPNQNATVELSNGSLKMNSTVLGQNGLVGIRVDGIQKNKSYQVSLDLKIFDIDNKNLTNSTDKAFFNAMVYVNTEGFNGSRYSLYSGDNTLGITPVTNGLIKEENTHIFAFTATEDGYVVIALRANVSSVGYALYANIDNLKVEEIDTFYRVTFKDENETEISSSRVLAGSKIVAPTTPTKESTETIVYTFGGWYDGDTKLEENTVATKDVVYTARYTESARQYTITYYNEDGITVYQTQTVSYGEPVTLIAAPTASGKNGSWVGTVYATMPAADISYTLSYEYTVYTATITVNNEAYSNNTYPFTDANKAEVLAQILALFTNNAQYTYSHDIPTELPLTNVDYNITRTTNQYTIQFLVDDAVHYSASFEYGETPSCENPTKENYRFVGWTPTVVAVVSNAEYRAVFAANLYSVTETFQGGEFSGRNYTGTYINAVRPNDNSSWELAEYNGSQALAISKLSTASSSGYAGFYVTVNPNTTYKVNLDLAAVGSTTADLSSSTLILFEVYENASIGTNAARISLFNNTGRWLSTNQKVSSFSTSSGYNVIFTTSDFTGSGFVYITLRLDKTLNTENVTVYVDNLSINECDNTVLEKFETGSVNSGVYTGEVSGFVYNSNSSLSLETYNESQMLKSTVASGVSGYMAVKINVEAGKQYMINFDAYIIGADNTNYAEGTTSGNSATIMIYNNIETATNTERLTFMACKANKEVTNTPLVNLLNTAPPNYSCTFTAINDGYVVLAIRTNNIAQESYIYLDNLQVSCLS